MENVFVQYFSKSLLYPQEFIKEYGPVITISREVGCGATKIACMLQESINKNIFSSTNWQVINKDILERSAMELNVKSRAVSRLFNSEKKGFYAEIIESFSGKNFISDNRIKRTINKVVKELGEAGNVIIVGRGGYVFTSHIKKSLHIRLIAPFNLRVDKIAKRFNISNSEAKMKVLEEDERRRKFIQLYDNNKNNNYKFDAVFNMSSFSYDEILKIIMKMVEFRKLI